MVDRQYFRQCAQPWIVWSKQDRSPFSIDDPCRYLAKAHSPALRLMFSHQQELGKE